MEWKKIGEWTVGIFRAKAENEWRKGKIEEQQAEIAALRAENERLRQRREQINPIDTITEHGLITKGPDGYPERVTSWEKLKDGELAPPPASPPKGDSE